MRKLLAISLIFLISVFAGCTAKNATSSDISSEFNSAESTTIFKTENSTEENSSENITENKKSEVQNSTSTQVKNNTVSSKTNSTGSKSYTSEKGNAGKEKAYNTNLNTITINQKTRYFGFIGYFALNSDNSDVLTKFDRYSIPYKKDFPYYSCHATEYRAEDGTPILFVGPDTDRIVLRDETPLYKEGGPYRRTVKIIDGEGIVPKSDILPENCDTLYTKKLVNYLGYEGYFVDEHTQEALAKGYGTFPTEYYDVKTDSNIKFVFATKDSESDDDLKIQRKVYEKGIGTIPVNVVQYADTIPLESYKTFKYSVGVYYYKDKDYNMKPQNSGEFYDQWYGDIEIFTVGKDNTAENEIKVKYEEKYGQKYCWDVDSCIVGYFYVKGYEGVCEVYQYRVFKHF